MNVNNKEVDKQNKYTDNQHKKLNKGISRKELF